MDLPQDHNKSIRDAVRHVCPKPKDPYRLAGKMSWEIMGELGYADKGEFMAYKNLMLKMAIMEAMSRDES